MVDDDEICGKAASCRKKRSLKAAGEDPHPKAPRGGKRIVEDLEPMSRGRKRAAKDSEPEPKKRGSKSRGSNAKGPAPKAAPKSKRAPKVGAKAKPAPKSKAKAKPAKSKPAYGDLNDDVKARLSRKSAAYHRAFKQARNENNDELVCRELAREAASWHLF